MGQLIAVGSLGQAAGSLAGGWIFALLSARTFLVGALFMFLAVVVAWIGIRTCRRCLDRNEARLIRRNVDHDAHRPMNFSLNRRAILGVLISISLALLEGCATIRFDVPRPSSRALAQPEQTALGRVFADRRAAHPDWSGFHVLDTGAQAFVARAALADAAERTLDLQYYIVQNDVTTALLMQRIVSAAQRGVRVRIMLDDFHGPNRQFASVAMAADPHIEVRLFNPFLQRGQSAQIDLSRLWELFDDGERLDRRMHIKLWIADNAAGIFGGRNLGDEYFDAGADTNFRDVDLLTVGPLVSKLSGAFDEYWNSKWTVPVAAVLDSESVPEATRRALSGLDKSPAGAGGTEFGHEEAAADFRRQLTTADLPFIWAPAYAIFDGPAGAALTDSHLSHIGPRARGIIEAAQSEIILISPYFVPSEQLLAFLTKVRKRGVRVAVLTNSLASTDALAVHAGYARYRADLLRNGIELFEMRPHAVASHTRRSHRWIRSSESSLHAKVLIVDRSTAFVGSMNFDPRSRMHNTELFVGVESAEVASKLAALFDEGVDPDHAFHVLLRKPEQSGDALVWITEDQGNEVRYESEPLAGFWKQLWSGVLSVIVPEHEL
jgi:putative cardiolipin synthase